MPNRTNRRQFLQTTALTGVGFWVAGGVQAQESKSPNEKIRIASIGIGGKGSSDSNDAGAAGQMVAICDVDEGRLKARRKSDSRAPKTYTDFRKMLEEMDKQIDAVTVSTPDHTHAAAALMAMRMGKHCFCQKPLTHTIYEARLMGQVAREKKVATQMGNQGTAEAGVRKAAAADSRRRDRQGQRGPRLDEPADLAPGWRAGETKVPPKELKWDEWLGPAPERPYAAGYHPFAWRGWWDFGTGALGDMACHTLNMPFMGLDLRDPISVQATTSGHNKDSYPKWSVITFEFAGNDKRPGLKVFWYDGGKKPDKDLIGGKDPKGSGCCLVGDKGKIYSPNDYGAEFELLGDADKEMKVEYPASPGHFVEWINAIKGGPQAMSNFPDYAGPLTETILLGNLAVWVAANGEGQKVEWDAKNMKVKNVAGLEQIVKPVYRKGYTLDV